MSNDDHHHPRLLMLHHADGRIEGRAKYHKLLFNYVDEEANESRLGFVAEDFGPFDPGLTKAMRRYQDLNLVELEEEFEPYAVEETEKGKRYLSGLERTKMVLDDKFQETKSRILRTVNRHGDKSANEMVQRENIQAAKEEPFREELD